MTPTILATATGVVILTGLVMWLLPKLRTSCAIAWLVVLCLIDQHMVAKWADVFDRWED